MSTKNRKNTVHESATPQGVAGAHEEDLDDEDLDWDEGEADQELVEELQRRGECVFCHEWEGGPGAFILYVYKMDDGYYAYDMFEETVDGPYGSLVNAIPDEWLTVSPATVSIECSEIKFRALTRMLTVEDGADEEITVNGRNWTTTK